MKKFTNFNLSALVLTKAGMCKGIVIAFVVGFMAFSAGYAQIPKKTNLETKTANKNSNFKKDYQQFLENQQTPLLTANGEAFRLDGLIWQRKYGEKEYCLAPTMQDISAYSHRIRQLDDKENGIIKSKFHFLNVDVSSLSKSLLMNMGINIPDYVQNNVNVYLPEIDIDKLSQNGINFTFLESYGQNEGEIIETKGAKSTIWSENWETNSCPSSLYHTSHSSSKDVSWGDVSSGSGTCKSHGGNWSIWCAAQGTDYNSAHGCSSGDEEYYNDMDAAVWKYVTIGIPCYTNVVFKFWLWYYTESGCDFLCLYFHDGNDWTSLIDSWDGTSQGYWTSESYNIDGSWNEFDWQFRFVSDGLGATKEGAYIDDLELTGTLYNLPGTATVSGPGSACQGDTKTYIASASNTISYSWSLPSGWSGSSTTSSITVTVGSNSGNVCATPHNSCGDGTQGCKYTDVTNSIDEISSKYITKIYPNPAFDKLNIEFTDNINKIEKITLSNMLGQAVYSIKGKKINTRNFVIDLSEYKSGVYYLNIRTKEDGTMRNKISVVR